MYALSILTAFFIDFEIFLESLFVSRSLNSSSMTDKKQILHLLVNWLPLLSKENTPDIGILHCTDIMWFNTVRQNADTSENTINWYENQLPRNILEQERFYQCIFFKIWSNLGTFVNNKQYSVYGTAQTPDINNNDHYCSCFFLFRQVDEVTLKWYKFC